MMKTDISIKHKPVARPRAGRRLEKTIIIVRGSPNQGKTTLCEYLVNEKTAYISFDFVAGNLGWCDIKDLHNFRQTLEKPHDMIDQMNKYINDTCANRFLRKAFRVFIENLTDPYVIIDGHFFTLPKNHRALVDRCRRHKYRLWIIDRYI